MSKLKPTPETYNEWQQAFDYFNQVFFDNQLPPCLITLQREKNTMGYFSYNRFANKQGIKTDEIALNPAFFAVAGMDVALSTLAHEMVHLWQQHFGDPGRGRYHNKEWANKMESIGLMPSHNGLPDGKKTGDLMSDYIISGGVFEKSIEQLVNNGFEMQWMDRLVARPRQSPAESSGTVLTSLTSSSVIAESIGLSQDIADVIDVDFTRITQSKQGNRSKYICGSCNTNLWGKANLHIICGECEEAFTEQNKVEEGNDDL